MPRVTLVPPVSIARRRAAGFPTSVLVGASASIMASTANRALPSAGRSRSAASTSSRMNRDHSR